MKKLVAHNMRTLFIAITACVGLLSPMMASHLFSAEAGAPALKIGVVNFKECVEKSKLGKQEQGNFEALKKQLEEVLIEREKALTELSNKISDPDYLDSLSRDAENELKHKFRSMSQELNQFQSQYYQALNQTNMKIIQSITEVIGKASQEVAKTLNLDLVLNEESGFFYSSKMDISKEVVKMMDVYFETMPKETVKSLPKF